MVAPVNVHKLCTRASRGRRVACTVVRVDEFARLRDGSLAARPSRLVPWADPYIAGLVRRLQSEVRFERAAAEPGGLATAPMADLDPPSPAFDDDGDQWDASRWEDAAE